MTTEQDTSTTGGTPRRSTSVNSQDRLQDAVSHVTDRVTDTAQQEVGTRVDSSLSRAGDVLEQVAGAVRRTGDQLRQDQPQVANLADTAAGQVDRAAQYLRGSDSQQILAEAERFARQQPAIFIGGAVMLGLVAARFLKASPSGMRGAGSGYGGTSGYGSSSYGASGYGSLGRDSNENSLRAVGPGRSSGGTRTSGGTSTGTHTSSGTGTRQSGSGSLTDESATTSSDAGVLEHGRA
jgi:hypothetical protein